MTPDWKALCAELIETLSKYQERLEETYHPDRPEAKELDAGFRVLERARAALEAQPEPVEPMMINCRWDGPSPEPHASVGDWFEQEGSKGLLCGLRISALPLRGGARTSPEPLGPTDEELHQLWLDLYAFHDGPTSGDVAEIARAVLARWGHPAITPIPVSERLPEAGEMNNDDEVWIYEPAFDYPLGDTGDYDTEPGKWMLRRIIPFDTRNDRHWLPAHALPLPTPEP
jgi:hypothetical protein